PATGEMFGWSATDREPYARVVVAKPDGTVKTRDLDVGSGLWASNLHDGWLSKDYLILGFEPFINTRERARQGKPVLGWDDSSKITLVLVPRSQDGEIRYIEAPFNKQGYNHTAGANTIGNQIYLDMALFRKVPFPFEQDMQPDGSFNLVDTGRIGRWIVDLDKNTVKSETLGERNVEEPKIDPRYMGRNYTFTFLMSGPTYFSFDTVIKRNVLTGEEESWTLKRDLPFGMFEGTFVPRSKSAPEADGYFIVPISRYAENMSNYLIFDTSAIAAGPVADIELPFQIGWGPHGNFMEFN
ncbi:MAG: carotenoid oxygenase family protein, partial [Acidobacteriota bacterium]